MSPAHLELSSSRCCQSINYVRSNLSNVRPKGRFERTHVLWIKKNYFQHCISTLRKSVNEVVLRALQSYGGRLLAGRNDRQSEKTRWLNLIRTLYPPAHHVSPPLLSSVAQVFLTLSRVSFSLSRTLPPVHRLLSSSQPRTLPFVDALFRNSLTDFPALPLIRECAPWAFSLSWQLRTSRVGYLHPRFLVPLA